MSRPEETEYGRCQATAKSTGNQCGRAAVGPHGKCDIHGGRSTGPKTDGGKETSSQNAVDHGAFREHFTNDLSEGEQDAFDDAFRKLENPDGAQEVARSAASICLLKFQRSGDERFLRRFEGICDKFGIAPADELEVSGSFSVEDEFMRNLKQANGHEVDD